MLKFDPWSECIILVKPTLVRKLIRAFTTILAEIFRSGMISGNIDGAHMIASKHLLPDLVIDNRPTQSTGVKSMEGYRVGCVLT